jgi:hypothetical protein
LSEEEARQKRDHAPPCPQQDVADVVLIGGKGGDEDAVVRRNGTFRKLASLACAMCVEGAIESLIDDRVFAKLAAR